MRAALITPARLGARSGNSITAVRWSSILKELGFEASISHELDGASPDILIALNAYRSADSIMQFREQHPSRPLVVALTGTDLYRFLDSAPERTLGAVDAADRLVVLNALAHKALPADQQGKCTLILESAQPPPGERRPHARHFDICVVGHLRAEKDPLQAAMAARGLPASSRIRVRHYGGAHSEEWGIRARLEMADNSRYSWYGEVPHWKIRRALKTSRLMVISSILEGGPNSLSEAIVAGLPVLATNIDGCVGVLGPHYPGYFPVGDTGSLRHLLLRAENEPAFLAELEASVVGIAPRFTRGRERDAWKTLLSELFDMGSKAKA